MTNTPKDKTPRKIAEEIMGWGCAHAPCSCDDCRTEAIEAAIAAERQKANRNFKAVLNGSGLIMEQDKKIASLERELAEAKKGVVESYGTLLIHPKVWGACIEAERQMQERIKALEAELAEASRRAIEYKSEWESAVYRERGRIEDVRGLTTENERLREGLRKALDGCDHHEIGAWGCGLCDDQYRPLLNEAKTLTSPQEKKEPVCQHDKDVTCSKCRGDSAGPEKHDKDIERIAFHYAYYDEIEAVIEAVRNMMKVDPSLLNNSLGSAYAIKHYCEVRQALEALDRARGEGKHDGHE